MGIEGIGIKTGIKKHDLPPHLPLPILDLVHQ